MGKIAISLVGIPVAIVVIGVLGGLYLYKKANEVAGDYFFGEKPKK